MPLEETLAAFTALTDTGKIRHWGVSNFDVADMDELASLPGGDGVASNQVLYNLARRGIEFDLLPWCGVRGIPVTAYSPIEQGRLLGHPELRRIASHNNATPAQVALAWALRNERVVAIPKAGTPAHAEQNRAALDLLLSPDDIAALDRSFPPPTAPRALEMI